MIRATVRINSFLYTHIVKNNAEVYNIIHWFFRKKPTQAWYNMVFAFELSKSSLHIFASRLQCLWKKLLFMHIRSTSVFRKQSHFG